MRIGRPTTSGVEGEKSTISVRTAVDLKRQLDEAAKWSGRSLSQEAESRLEQSFRDDHWAHLFSDVFYGRELATLLEIIGRAMRDAGAHAVNQTVAPGDPWPNWIDSPYAFGVAVHAANHVLNVLRPPGEVLQPTRNSPAEARLGDAIPNGLLADIAREEAMVDLMEPWAQAMRGRLGHLRDRLAGFDYDLAARSVALPTPSSPGIYILDTDDRTLLEEPAKNGGAE